MSPSARSELDLVEANSLPSFAQDSLSQFFHRGVRCSSWTEFDVYEHLRIAYIGTPVSNFTHLVNLNHNGERFLTYPHPPIHPHLPWEPDAQDPVNRWRLTDRISDLSSFPGKEIRDELIEAFFNNIHPYFPIVDESDFRRQYADPSNPPPLLLFQAILLAGAHVCNHPKIAEARYVVKSILYRRAKLLFDMRHENDRLNLVQAALLFTWHLENADSASLNSYYWIGVACRIAFGIGIHRDILADPDIPGRMPLVDRRLYRRVWWVLFQVELMSALEHGRPSMIHPDDFDQPPLELNDLREMGGEINTKINFEYCSRNIELCHIVLRILRTTSPGAVLRGESPDPVSLNSSLVAWVLTIPQSDEFWTLQLYLHYQAIVIHLHRLFIDSAERISMSPDSGEQCNAAAQMILSTFDMLIRQSLIQQCYFTSVMALIAAGIHISRGIQQSINKGSTLLALSALRNLESVVYIAQRLTEAWPNAEGVQKLFRGLLERYTELIYHRQRNEEGLDTTIDFNNIDWEEIMLFDSQLGLLDKEWMNTRPGE